MDSGADASANTVAGTSACGRWIRVHVHLAEADRGTARFFGPAVDDLVDVASGYIMRYRICVDAGIGSIRVLTEDPNAAGLVAATGVVIGMVAGGIAGSAVAVAVVIINVAVMIGVAGVALATGVVLYSLDRISRFLAGILMSCPRCHMKITRYPIYRCPRCSAKHHDIGPGSCGITVRHCICGNRLPTSLLTGAGHLEAECPHCARPLPPEFGDMPVIVLPVFGSLNVGKTQLMYTLVRAFDSLVTAEGGTLKFEGDTADRLNRIKDDLVNKGRPSKTIRGTPSAYLLRIKMGLVERRIFIFDAAGEMHYNDDDMKDINYLDKAKVFVFVVDPLASDSLWLQLPEASRATLEGIRSSRTESELAYQKIRERMRDLEAKTRHLRLAIVLSKADILEEVSIQLTAEAGRPTLADWFESDVGMGMGNVWRAAYQDFRTIEFFQTAAFTSETGMPDKSVDFLARWLMQCEGVNFKDRVSYGT